MQRLERCLSEAELTIAANAELRRLLGTVVVRPDGEAPDGLAIEIRGDLGRVLAAGAGSDAGGTMHSGLLEEAAVLLGQISVVAGAGFGLQRRDLFLPCRLRRKGARGQAPSP